MDLQGGNVLLTQKDLQDAQLDNRVIAASLEQRCHTADQALDKAVEEKRRAEEETNNMYEQVLRMKSESEMLLANQVPNVFLMCSLT